MRSAPRRRQPSLPSGSWKTSGLRAPPTVSTLNVFKALGLLSLDGVPAPRYYEFLDQSQSGRVLAEAIEEAYGDLFQLRRDAYSMSRPELKGKIKTLTQGQVSDAVVDKMAMTFLGLVGLADFNAPQVPGVPTDVSPTERSATSDEIDSQVAGTTAVDAQAAGIASEALFTTSSFTCLNRVTRPSTRFSFERSSLISCRERT
jgi:Family of unknown function (DUF5343)